MQFVGRFIGSCVVLLACGCAHRAAIAEARDGIAAEYVGSSPGGALAREFLGGLASNAPCHSITWRMILTTNSVTRLPSTFKLSALYHVPTRSNPNRSEDGPKVELDGTWEIIKGAQFKAGPTFCRITTGKPQRSLSFVKVGDHLLHLLNPDGTLAVGTGGESYTLNLASRAETPGDRDQVNNAPEISYKISPMATGPTVFGVFEGRTPCQGISRELKKEAHPGCIKSKWRVTLYQDPKTSAPTTYKVEGSLFREGAREGSWSITRGAAIDTGATVYQLSATATQPALLLLKGDDNVLFFLNPKRELLVGHAEFSYTLNRAAAR